MSEEIKQFLASVPIFASFSETELERIALLFHKQFHAAGSIILNQGAPSEAVYLLQKGELAVRVNRITGRETVAFLQPPAVFGELSFITGRTCSADVEVTLDADVLCLPKSALSEFPEERSSLLQALVTTLAERLHDTVTRGSLIDEPPVIVLFNHPNWKAPKAFAHALAHSLGHQTGDSTLLVHLGENFQDGEAHPTDNNVFQASFSAGSATTFQRDRFAGQLAEWKQRFVNIVLNPTGPDSLALADQALPFTEFRGDLLGPGDAVPPEAGPKHFVVQDAEQPTLPVLTGSRQLMWGVVEAERDVREGRSPEPGFTRTVDSMARFVEDLQVGLALGGGAAWGFVHVGVLSVLVEAGLPIDVISGCSMGGVIGALFATGHDIDEMRKIADYWKTRTWKFIEFRAWKMHLIREKTFRKVFRSYLNETPLNQAGLPIWFNAVDIKSGKEFTIQDGTFVDALRASISMPGLLPPCVRDPHLLVDAGIMNPVPVQLTRQMGSRFVIGVNAMAPLEAHEVKTRYPLNILDVMLRCMRVTGWEIGQARAESADITLNPHLEAVSMLEFSRCDEIIRAGEDATREILPVILNRYENLKKTLPRSRSTNR